ncbi:cytochrome P450 [Rhizodiscina lignyota]|uniref:Cytochrome P450 n=1 Tax=Rhizodiscina lignyota TaxID=1504668 RepID=A0A9P4IKK8_9PEZI|nr:cytochrome P450 [Rhizodiscina lignyota]
MELPLAITIGVCFLVASFIYKFIVYPAFFSPLSKIPAANWTIHICPLWIYWIRYINIENQTILKLHQAKGPIVRIGPSELSVNCYDGGLKTIYGGGFPKHDFYARRFTNYDTENMFTMVDSKKHSARKRMLSSVYSKSTVLSSPTIRETTKTMLFERLLPIFQHSVETGQSVEVHSLSYAYAMDSFMAYQFGLSLGSNFVQDVEKRKWYMHNFFSRRPYLFWPDNLPGLTSALQKIGIRLIPKWCDDATEDLASWNLEICDQAEKKLAAETDIPPGDYPVIYATERAQFMKADGKERPLNGQSYPPRLELASDAYDHNAAAHETSGDTLTWVYYEMSRNPSLQKQLREELLSLDPPINFPPEDPSNIVLPDFKAVDNLPLLGAILQETLRIWTAVPGAQPRLTPYPSCSLAGYDNIPPNVRVQSYASVLHRNPEVFPDPEAWKPERWLKTSPEQLAEMKRWFWAFGSGGSMCIGSNVAMHTMKHAIAAIYTNYTTSIVDAEGIEQDEGFSAGPKGNKLVLKFHRI